jgi:uncharacterized membrane protein YczE
MNEQTTKLIEQLAQKLGTTAEYLWTVLVKQAHVEIYIFITTLILTIIGAFLTGLLLRNSQKYWEQETAPISAWMSLTFGIIIGIATVVGLIATIANIPDVITAINNPEYWALKEVFGACK